MTELNEEEKRMFAIIGPMDEGLLPLNKWDILTQKWHLTQVAHRSVFGCDFKKTMKEIDIFERTFE